MRDDDYDRPARGGYDDYDRPNRRGYDGRDRYDDDRYDDRYDDRDRYIQRARRDRDGPSHSGLGIVSTIIAIISGLAFTVVLFVGMAIEANNPGALDDDKSPQAAMVGGGVCLSGLGFVVSLILGCIGLSQPDRYKMFAILGTILSVLGVLILGGLMAIGIMMG